MWCILGSNLSINFCCWNDPQNARMFASWTCRYRIEHLDVCRGSVIPKEIISIVKHTYNMTGYRCYLGMFCPDVYCV